jgi:hypothetical protein
MTTFRVSKKQNFSVIDNTHLYDNRLSWKATAILTYLLSKPDNWVVHIKQLATAKKCGIKAVYTGVRELKALGYLEHDRIQGADGKFISGQYIVHEIPIIETNTPAPPKSKPHTQKGNAVKGNEQNRPILRTDLSVIQTKDVETPVNTDLELKTKDVPSAVSYEINKEQRQEALDLLPDKFRQQPLLLNFINKKCKVVSLVNLKSAIIYTNQHSKGNITRYRSYLGQCIDKGWALGLYEAQLLVDAEKIEADRKLVEVENNKRRLENEKIEKQRAEQREKEQIRLKYESNAIALKALQSLNPNRYNAVQEQALRELQSKMPTYTFDIEGTFVKSQMAIILGL